jgi:hypothetical protein
MRRGSHSRNREHADMLLAARTRKAGLKLCKGCMNGKVTREKKHGNRGYLFVSFLQFQPLCMLVSCNSASATRLTDMLAVQPTACRPTIGEIISSARAGNVHGRINAKMPFGSCMGEVVNLEAALLCADEGIGSENSGLSGVFGRLPRFVTSVGWTRTAGARTSDRSRSRCAAACLGRVNRHPCMHAVSVCKSRSRPRLIKLAIDSQWHD